MSDYLHGHHLHDFGLLSVKTQVRDCLGRYPFLVSTVQLGKGSLQFETLIFTNRGVGEAIPGFRRGYDSVEEATVGHCDVCNDIYAWDPDGGRLVLEGGVDYRPPYQQPAERMTLLQLLDSLKDSPFRRSRPQWNGEL